MTTTAVMPDSGRSAASMPERAEPFVLRKRIGSTVYTANAYFATYTKETLEDKILRVARNNGLEFQHETDNLTRTGLLPERSGAA